MVLFLQAKVALITGAAQGLGRSFATFILENGGNVLIVDNNQNNLNETTQELTQKFGTQRIAGYLCDVTKEHELKESFKKVKDTYGRLDIVVNNAGVAGISYETTTSGIKKLLDINLFAVIHGTQLALEELAVGGIVINISSTAGLTPLAFEPVYTASKYGVVGYTRSMAEQMQNNRGIRLTCLCPSFTDTAILKSAAGDALEMLGSVGIMKIDRVVEAFGRLLNNSNNNGGVMVVTPLKMQYHLPLHMKGKL